jgi:regulator of protease activity HflC (stomatin/prohibitin superfamily)
MLRRILVGDNERVLVIRKKRFWKILGPGDYWVLSRDVELETFSTREPVFASTWTNYLVTQKPELVAQYFTLIETGEEQVAIVYLDGKLARVIAPSSRVLYWRADVSVTFERIDIREIEVPERLLAPLWKLGKEATAQATFAVIEEGKRGLVFLDGRLVRELSPGTYAFWSGVAAPRVEALETRPQTLEIAGQEILTRDKVTVRVNISAVYEIVDVRVARSSVKDVNEYLYRALQIAVRQTLGKRSLDELLAEKTDLDETVSAEVRLEMVKFGVRVGAIALKDIILPGDIREILNQVVTAEKQAQANLIRRREETAATRSLLNTAKLMEDNPLLVRMKELEALEKIAGKVEKITVVGGLSALLEKTVMLKD